MFRSITGFYPLNANSTHSSPPTPWVVTNTSPDIAKCLKDKVTPWSRIITLQCIQSCHKNNPFITETEIRNTSANIWPIDFHVTQKKKSHSLSQSIWSYMICCPPMTASYFLALYSLCSCSLNTPTKLPPRSLSALFPLPTVLAPWYPLCFCLQSFKFFAQKSTSQWSHPYSPI